MRRALWQMADNEVSQLLDRAQLVYDELHLRHDGALAQVELLTQRRAALKKRSPEWHRVDNQLFAAQRDVDAIEQRIAAQRTLIRGLENEMNERNPPFWDHYTRERMYRNQGKRGLV